MYKTILKIKKNAPWLARIKLNIVKTVTALENSFLFLLEKVLFSKTENPQKIIIFKIGNIGDTICAIPSLIAIRKAYSDVHITLLTSPGKSGMVGAKELLSGASYINNIRTYYTKDIRSFSKKIKFIRDLAGKYDTFIHLPVNLYPFKLLLKNLLFAKLIGVKSAWGFKKGSIQLFKKVQVDYGYKPTEVENLLNLLKEKGISNNKPKFEFPITDQEKGRIRNIIPEEWDKELKVGIHPGAKREANRWPIEHLVEIARYLQNKYGVKIIILGGPGDVERAKKLRNKINKRNSVIGAGKCSLKESIELIKHCSFVIANSTGTIHMAAAVNVPTVGLYTIRDVPGRWFPYGNQHIVLYHTGFRCNYRNETCIERSIEAIKEEEVKEACQKILTRVNYEL